MVPTQIGFGVMSRSVRAAPIRSLGAAHSLAIGALPVRKHVTDGGRARGTRRPRCRKWVGMRYVRCLYDS
jgi:hypothetical protein